MEPESIALAIAECSDPIRLLGRSVPNSAFRALTLYDEVLELQSNLKHPSINVANHDNHRRVKRMAAAALFDFIVKLERIGSAMEYNFGLRLSGSMFLLMIRASLRFADTIEIETMEGPRPRSGADWSTKRALRAC